MVKERGERFSTGMVLSEQRLMWATSCPSLSGIKKSPKCRAVTEPGPGSISSHMSIHCQVAHALSPEISDPVTPYELS